MLHINSVVFSLMMHCPIYNDPDIIVKAKYPELHSTVIATDGRKNNLFMAIKDKYHLAPLGAQSCKLERCVNVNNHSTIALFLLLGLIHYWQNILDGLHNCKLSCFP